MELNFSLNSLKYYKTKLFCPNGHGVQPVTGAVEGMAVLECGCSRPPILPSRGVSVEDLANWADKEAMKLFPVASEIQHDDQDIPEPKLEAILPQIFEAAEESAAA